MKNNKKIILIALAILVVIFISYHFIIKSGAKKQTYEFYTMKPITIRKYVTADGTANPINTINVGAQVSGTFSRLFVWYNSVVKKGQLLAEINPTPFILRIDRDKANLSSARASVSKQKAIADYGKLTYMRDKELWKENLISHATEQNSYSIYLQNAAQLKYLEGAVKAADIQLKIDNINLSYTKIYSPVNGIIINVNVVVGQTVASNFRTPNLFTIGKNLTEMEIDTTTNEADIGEIKKGDEASFTLYAYPDKTFQGYVHNIRINPTTVSGVVSYNVTIYFKNKRRLALPGMTAISKIYVSEEKGVLGVPNSALRFIPPDENKHVLDDLSKRLKIGEGVVWILKNEKPKPVIVRLGINNDDYTGILSKDIKAGTKVITGVESDYLTGGRHRRRFFF